MSMPTSRNAYLAPIKTASGRLKAAITAAYLEAGGARNDSLNPECRAKLAEAVWKVVDAEEYSSVESPETQHKRCDQLWVVYNRLLDDLDDGRNEMRPEDRRRNADALAGRFPFSPQIVKERGDYWRVGKRWFGRFHEAEKFLNLQETKA